MDYTWVPIGVNDSPFCSAYLFPLVVIGLKFVAAVAEDGHVGHSHDEVLILVVYCDVLWGVVVNLCAVRQFFRGGFDTDSPSV